MDPILTVLIVVVIIQFVWLIVIQRNILVIIQKAPPGCCDRVENLYKWINETLLPVLANCVVVDPKCTGGAPDPWPPKGPGDF